MKVLVSDGNLMLAHRPRDGCVQSGSVCSGNPGDDFYILQQKIKNKKPPSDSSFILFILQTAARIVCTSTISSSSSTLWTFYLKNFHVNNNQKLLLQLVWKAKAFVGLKHHSRKVGELPKTNVPNFFSHWQKNKNKRTRTLEKRGVKKLSSDDSFSYTNWVSMKPFHVHFEGCCVVLRTTDILILLIFSRRTSSVHRLVAAYPLRVSEPPQWLRTLSVAFLLLPPGGRGWLCLFNCVPAMCWLGAWLL